MLNMVRRYSGSYLECPVTKNRAIELHCSFAYSALASSGWGCRGRRLRESDQTRQDWPPSRGLPVEGYDFLASSVFEQ